MLSDVHSGDRLAVGYTWLADGTKLGVCDGNGVNGLEYVGSLIYGKSSAGLQLSEALFKDGVIRVGENGSQELNYFLKDHLGSVRVIVDGRGSVTERNDYYPFGARHIRSDYAQSGNRWKYNGKEIQPTGNGGYLDYGARMYDAGIGRWLSVDPRAEDYLSQSPWHFSGNNPLLFVDAAGEDYWSTNDPDLIASFMYSLWSGFDTFNFYGWEHSSDAEFTGNLTYNDITGKYYTSYGTVRGGMATRIGLSFDAIIRPVVESYPYAGAFVREKLSGFWQYLGYYTGIGGYDTYSDIGNWQVNREGRLTGLQPMMGIAPTPSIGKVGFFQFTKSNLKLGQQMHKAYKLNNVIEGVAMKEFRGIKGIRPDFVDFSTRTIYELKLYNTRAIREGWKQLPKYYDLFQQTYKGPWKLKLDTYLKLK